MVEVSTGRFIGLLALATWLLGACSAVGTTPTNSGLYGQVLIGPMCPVERSDQPCPDQPYQATITVLDPNGKRVTQFQSDGQGNFRVSLAPGTYTLRPEPPAGKPLPYGQEQTVTVASGQFTQIIITYDSGIR